MSHAGGKATQTTVPSKGLEAAVSLFVEGEAQDVGNGHLMSPLICGDENRVLVAEICVRATYPACVN